MKRVTLKTATPQQLVALIVILLLLPRPTAPAQDGAPQPPPHFPQSVYPTEPAPPADPAVPPALTAVTPSTAAAGQTLLLTITGASTHFVKGSTTVNLGPGITPAQPTIINPASLSVSITVAPNAAPGPRTLTVTTGAEILTAPFQITAASTPPPRAPFSPIRVHCGGGIYLDPSGQTWASDTGFLGGNPFSVSSNIAATATPYLYQSERWNTGPVQYVFAVAPGTYNVRLKFAEIYFNQAGKRQFDINLNGTVVLPAFDILAAAGASNTAIDRVFTVDASSGQISILLVPILSNPKMSAIEILPQAIDLSLSPSVASLTPGQTQQFSALLAGTQNQNVNWSLNGAGTVSPSGLYTAPASITTRQTATVTATSQADGSKLASAAISLSPAWQTTTIGTPPSPGTYTYANGAQTVAGTGDLWGSDDYFSYVYQGLTGDGSITARYTSQDPCCLKAFSKAGLMIRGSTATGSAHAFVSILGAIVALLETRAADGAGTVATFGSAGVFWLKLTRAGNYLHRLRLLGRQQLDSCRHSRDHPDAVVRLDRLFLRRRLEE